MRSKKELEQMAQDMMLKLPQDLTASELGYVLSLMMKGHSIALKKKGI